MRTAVLALALLAAPVAVPAAATTISQVDVAPTRLRALTLEAEDFRLGGLYGTGTTVQGDRTAAQKIGQTIAGRHGLGNGAYITNNDAETMTWLRPPGVPAIWLRITDANDQPGQGGAVSWWLETAGSAFGLGPRLASGNVLWLRLDHFDGGPIAMHSGISQDGYSVEAFVPAVPLPAAGLLLAAGLALLALTRRRPAA